MEKKEICGGYATGESTLNKIKNTLHGEETIYDLSQVFKALGDPTRLKIIYVLSKNSLCVCDIAYLLDMTQSAISHQLRILRNLRLVKSQRKGRLVIYSLDDDHVLELFNQGLDHVQHR